MGTEPTRALGRPERMRAEPDAQLRAWISATATGQAAAARMGAARLRLASKNLARQGAPGPDMAVVEDHDLGAHLRARLYRPRLATLPVLVYLHGGGFVLGDLDTHDRLARQIAHHADVTVLAVDYRRAPESQAPAAIDDAVRAMQWADAMLGLLGGDERAGVGLAGDSAGGLIAAAAAARLRDEARHGRAERAGHLLLLTPQTDLTLTTPSVTEKGHGWGLDVDDLRWYVDQWLPGRMERLDPAYSPFFAPLAGMPPTFIVTAEHDPLRDDGMAFAERLRGSGGVVEHLHFENLVHGFFQLDRVSPACADATAQSLRRYGAFLRHALALDEA